MSCFKPAIDPAIINVIQELFDEFEGKFRSRFQCSAWLVPKDTLEILYALCRKCYLVVISIKIQDVSYSLWLTVS